MATSKFMDGPVGRYVGSRKNLAGTALGVGAVAAQLTVGLGEFWLAVVAGAYAVGALVMPGEPPLTVTLGAGAPAQEVEQGVAKIRRAAARLEPGTREPADRLLVALDEIVARWDELAGAPEQRYLVESIVGDYLPTSLRRYLDLPRRVRVEVRGGTSPQRELVAQLELLAEEAGRIRDAVYSRALDALDDHGRFLREKFKRSELDL
ncbi:hypothetical protein [Myceligenerans pegani]|uniref:Integral membrane protein n=1 Tax=Myceligenerans pegani TaxID=2776917 RepID=A0ABR9MWG5_9MICO|nr:hypothetical protein [Myceligenerans sp. TRM 65318]MBE1875744.1 hypothetical protein [Myceligenerans sp. TRM 65318]MBE3018015.1 hypothetical protein [Myceligenerans sp. TRM 65318]